MIPLYIHPQKWLEVPYIFIRAMHSSGMPSLSSFVCIIEPLVEVKRSDSLVIGIDVGPQKHKISLYADDILLFFGDPRSLLPELLF